MPRKTAELIKQRDLQRWKLLPSFSEALQKALAERGHRDDTWADPRRKLEVAQYLSLFLFGLFNPVVKTMRGLCAATEFERVQQQVSGARVSLGSFSEAQALVDPALLEAVFRRIAAELPAEAQPLAGLTGRELLVVDTTVWKVVPRMAWAFWRQKGGSRAGPDAAIRLHLHFDLKRQQPHWGEVTPAKVCERAHWREHAEPGMVYIGDCNYSNNYGQLREMQVGGVDFMVRLAINTQWVVEHEETLTEADSAASVVWAGTVRLGKNGDGPRVRVIDIVGEEEHVLLATSLSTEDLPPELAATIYRHRWQIEMFFRWLKCILGCRHFLAESPRGVAIQVYLALIAAVLLVLFSGKRPNRRQMEAIQFLTLGWASAEAAAAQVARYATRKKA